MFLRLALKVVQMTEALYMWSCHKRENHLLNNNFEKMAII